MHSGQSFENSSAISRMHPSRSCGGQPNEIVKQIESAITRAVRSVNLLYSKTQTTLESARRRFGGIRSGGRMQMTLDRTLGG